jgi:hypothetical protein
LHFYKTDEALLSGNWGLIPIVSKTKELPADSICAKMLRLPKTAKSVRVEHRSGCMSHEIGFKLRMMRNAWCVI